MKYIIKSGEDRDEADMLKAAKLIAGEWQLERDRLVYIERMTLPRKRWKATLERSGQVRLDELHCDQSAGGAPGEVDPWELSPPLDVKYPNSPAKERARRVRDYQQQWERIENTLGAIVDAPSSVRRKFERGEIQPKTKKPHPKCGRRPPKKVVCLATGKIFSSPAEAARAAMMGMPLMYNRLRNRNGWDYVTDAMPASQFAAPHRRGKPAKLVICLATGRIFDSVPAAASFANISRQAMQRKIRQRNGWAFANNATVTEAQLVAS